MSSRVLFATPTWRPTAQAGAHENRRRIPMGMSNKKS